MSFTMCEEKNTLFKKQWKVTLFFVWELSKRLKQRLTKSKKWHSAKHFLHWFIEIPLHSYLIRISLNNMKFKIIGEKI